MKRKSATSTAEISSSSSSISTNQRKRQKMRRDGTLGNLLRNMDRFGVPCDEKILEALDDNNNNNNSESTNATNLKIQLTDAEADLQKRRLISECIHVFCTSWLLRSPVCSSSGSSSSSSSSSS
eukprot:Filipodium_phascolosomae@DN6527_c0_g1_i1.p1